MFSNLWSSDKSTEPEYAYTVRAIGASFARSVGLHEMCPNEGIK